MTTLFQKNIDQIVPYEPGKPIEEVQRELGLKEIIKLASNENPLGVSAKVVAGLQKKAASVFLYPDGSAWKLKKKLAQHLKVRETQLVLGNGSNEIIEFMARGFLKDGRSVLTSQYAFLVYPLLTQVYGGSLVTVPMKDFRFDLDAMAKKINSNVRLIFIANPNNPTGTYVTKKELETFLKKVPADCMVCIDEAYFEFTQEKDYPNGLDFINKGNVVVLRTFSKAYGLAGLRIGYGVANERVAKYLNKIRQPFNVNTLAQEAACLALQDKTFLKNTQKTVWQGKKVYYDAFKAMRLNYISSQANFVLVDVGTDAQNVFKECLKLGVIIRSMKAYGLDQYIRISVGKARDNQKCIQALKQVLNH